MIQNADNASAYLDEVREYSYDPFGLLDTVTAAGQIVESYKYDGLDRTVSHSKCLTRVGPPSS